MAKEKEPKQKQKEAKNYNHGDVVLRFNKVSFGFTANKQLLEEVDFSVRERAKMTLMGQNGAGKSTIFKMISGEIQPEEGVINIKEGATIATAMQVIPRDYLDLTVIQFFEKAFKEKIYDIEPRVKKILDVVNLRYDDKKKIRAFSGGQQARLLLAFALIQNPDILLLDEPTNNLDVEGIERLTKFLVDYPKTCIVISHDAKFLNAFTHGVLYLDSFTRKVEQYVGDYFDVVEEIARRIERERQANVRLERDIANRKEQFNFFAQKGGKMRDVARKMKEAIDELEAQIVDMRQEDKTIRNFVIPVQSFENSDLPEWKIAEIKAVTIMENHKPVQKKANVILKRKNRLLIKGPNGIGKSTFLRLLADGEAKNCFISDDVKVGYYQQDFAGLDFERTVYQSLADVMEGGSEETLRSIAANFLLSDDLLKNKVGSLSEGQKGLLAFARFVAQRPGLLILDEPTNHINFRHLPVIAEAVEKYDGAVIMVSHMREFVEKIKFDHELDLGEL